MPAYFEMFEKRWQILEAVGFSMATPALRGLTLREYERAGMLNSPKHNKLSNWKKYAFKTDTTKQEDGDEIEVVVESEYAVEGKECLNEICKSYVFLKKAPFKFNLMRIKLQNDYNEGHDNYPPTVAEANLRLETWRAPPPVLSSNTGNSASSTGGQQHVQDSEQKSSSNNSKNRCFKCEREGCVAYKCKETTKEDGPPVNNKEQEKAEHQKWKGNRSKGLSYYEKGLPTFEETLDEE